MVHPTRQTERGAALVAVLLLTMILSALGALAMQNTFYSMQLSGNYRMRRQAAETADAALTFFSVRTGDKPINYLSRMSVEQRMEEAQGVALSNQLNDRGAMARFKASDFQTGGITSPLTGETGFFSGTDLTTRSHESDASLGAVSFEVVIRDPSNGPPPPGSDNAFCSKKVYIGSRATYDALERVGAEVSDRNWTKPARAASSMVGLEAWVGPVPCQGGGSR